MEEYLKLLPWLIFLCLFIWYMISSVIPSVKRYRRRNRMLDEIDEKYESLRKLRKDLIYHIDWARERGENRRANELEEEIEGIEKELEELRGRFNEIQNGKGDISKIH